MYDVVVRPVTIRECRYHTWWVTYHGGIMQNTYKDLTGYLALSCDD